MHWSCCSLALTHRCNVVRETNACLLTNASAFWAGRVENWPGRLLYRTYRGHLFPGECSTNLVSNTVMSCYNRPCYNKVLLYLQLWVLQLRMDSFASDFLQNTILISAGTSDHHLMGPSGRYWPLQHIQGGVMVPVKWGHQTYQNKWSLTAMI